MDPRRFHSGRWLLLAEGVLVSAFGIAGLVSAALHPHTAPTGAPVLGLATTPAHSAILLALGLVAIAAVGKRRAAITVTALSAVTYMMLLFFSSVATTRAKPTPLGFHAADIVLHGVLAVVNLALLMWLIPDELGDEAWGPRRRGGRGRDRRQPSSFEAVTDPATGSHAPGQPSQRGPTDPPVSIPPAHPAPLEQSSSPQTNEPSEHDVQNSTPPKHFATRTTDALRSRGVVPMVVAVLVAVVGTVISIRRR